MLPSLAIHHQHWTIMEMHPFKFFGPFLSFFSLSNETLIRFLNTDIISSKTQLAQLRLQNNNQRCLQIGNAFHIYHYRILAGTSAEKDKLRFRVNPSISLITFSLNS